MKEMDDMTALYNRKREEEEREEKLHKARMITAIKILKQQHREELERFEK